MTESLDTIIPLLREMRHESAACFDQVEARLTTIDARSDKMDESLVAFRHALSADSLLNKIVTGEFEERLGVLERRLSDLETQK